MQARAPAPLRLGQRLQGVHDGGGTPGQAIEAEAPGPELVAPHGIEIVFEQCLQRRDIGGAAPEERVIEAQEGHPDPLTGVGRSAFQGRELERGLLVAAAHVRRLGGQQARLEALPGVDGGPRHALGERVVAAFASGPGARQKEVGAAASADESQRCEEQRVVLASAGGRLRQCLGEHALAPGADARAHDVAVDRMGQADLQAAPVHTGADEAPVLERGDGPAVGQLVERRLRQRLAESGELQGVPFRVRERAQPGGDQLDQAGRRPQRAAQAPDPALVAQRAVLAARRPPARGGRGDRPASARRAVGATRCRPGRPGR